MQESIWYDCYELVKGPLEWSLLVSQYPQGSGFDLCRSYVTFDPLNPDIKAIFGNFLLFGGISNNLWFLWYLSEHNVQNVRYIFK